MSTSLTKFVLEKPQRDAWLRPLQEELQSAWRRGRRVFAEDFATQLRHAKANDDEWLTLLECEILVRREIGEKPTHDEYSARFPRFAQALSLHFVDSVTQLVLSKRFDVAKTTPAKAVDVTIPGYELLEVLGRGGMGIVYKARQLGLNRLVALKMVLTGRFAGDDELARFRREAEAVAALDHPSIVRVYEVGEHEGTPFITFEYVNGGTLANVLAKGALAPRDAALVAEGIARAAHEAHLQGIVHRDLKPANILLETRGDRASRTTDNAATTQASVPQASIGLPKITDFGIAKRLNETYALTASGTAAGTPQYMAPEQALGKKDHPVNGQADVYSIGVILYEMLTRRTPFEGDNPLEVVQKACKQAPPPPTRYNAAIPRDLETIILRCLEKDPSHRFATALLLAEELARWTAGKPIVSRPVGPLEQGVRWCQRNPLVAGLLFGLFVVLFAGVIVSTTLAIKAHDAADQAQREKWHAEDAEAAARRNAAAAEQNALEARANALQAKQHASRAQTQAKLAEEAKENEAQLRAEATKRESRRAKELYAADMLVAFADWHAGNVTNTEALLRKYRPKSLDDPDPRGFEWHYLRNLGMQAALVYAQMGMEHCAAVPNSNAWALADGDRVTVCDPATCRVLETFGIPGLRHRLREIVYAPDGASLACLTSGPECLVIDAKTKQRRHRLLVAASDDFRATRAAFTPDGQTLYVATCAYASNHTPGHVLAYNLTTGEVQQRLPGLKSAVVGLAMAPDGKTLFAVEHNGQVHRWDMATGKETHHYTIPDGVAGTMATYSGQGDLLAVGTGRGTIAILDGRDLKLRHELRGHVDEIRQLAFAKEGNLLASAAGGHIIHVWDAQTGEERRRCYGHKAGVVGLAFGAKSNELVSVARDHQALLWDIDHNAAVTSVEPAGQTTIRVLPLPNPEEVLLVSSTANFQRLNLRTKQVGRMQHLGTLATAAYDACVTEDGATLALCTHNKGIILVSLSDPQAEPRLLPLEASRMRRCAFAPDGKTLIVATSDGRLLAYPTQGDNPPRLLAKYRTPLRSIAFPPKDATRFLTTGSDGTIRLWETTTGNEILTLQFDAEALPEMATFAPDSKTFAVAGSDGVVQLRNTATGRIMQRFRGHASRTNRLAFDSRGRRLVTSSEDATLRLWDVETGMTTLTLHGHIRGVRDAIFSADDRRIISVSDGPVKIWDASASHKEDDGRRLAESTRLVGAEATYHPDGRITASVQIANKSGRDLLVPHATQPGYGLYVAVSVERLGDDPVIPQFGKPSDHDQYRLGQTKTLPRDRVMKDDYQFSVRFQANAKQWPPGKYRLHWEHTWPGEPMNDNARTSCLVVIPEPSPE